MTYCGYLAPIASATSFILDRRRRVLRAADAGAALAASAGKAVEISGRHRSTAPKKIRQKPLAFFLISCLIALAFKHIRNAQTESDIKAPVAHKRRISRPAHSAGE
jgi:hypothetical protein